MNTSTAPALRMRIVAAAIIAAFASVLFVGATAQPAHAAGYTTLGYKEGFTYSACRASATLLKVRAKSDHTSSGWSFRVSGKANGSAYYSNGTTAAVTAGNYSYVSVYVPAGTTIINVKVLQWSGSMGAEGYANYGISAVGSC